MECWKPTFHYSKDEDIWYGEFKACDNEDDTFNVVMFMTDEDDYDLSLKCEDISKYRFGLCEMQKLYDTIGKTYRELKRMEETWNVFD